MLSNKKQTNQQQW